jgi:DNA-binding NtrC family response regulator
LLTEALLRPLNENYGCRVADVDSEVLRTFAGYSWPGNVRELRNVLSRAVIMAGEGTLELRHLPGGFASTASKPSPEARPEQDGVFLPVGATVREAERALIERTLAFADNNKTRAAAILGIGLKTLHTKLKSYRKNDADSNT